MSPLTLDPDATFEVVLKTDQDKPAETRPTFLFKHRTLRQAQQFNQKIDEASGPGQSDATGTALAEAVLEGLAGWRHMIGADGAEIPYEPENLADILTPSEAWELYASMLAGRQIDLDEAKNSGSPSPSSSDSSAQDAPAAESSTDQNGA